MSIFFLHGGEPGLASLLDRLTVKQGTRPPEAGSGALVIRWGKTAPEPPETRIIGRIRPVLRAEQARTVAALLTQEGIRTVDRKRGKEEPFHYQYVVPVFDTRAIGLFEKKLPHHNGPAFRPHDEQSGRFREIALSGAPFHAKRAARQAVRAVYALGLDYGIVKIATTLKGETLVEEVDPSPMPGPRLSSLFAAAIERLRKEREAGEFRPEPLLLGADPEFLLRRPGGRIVSASRYMERMGEAGCDGIILRGQRVILPLAELRPEPSPSPRVLVENLKEAMLQASSQITDPELEWLTGGMPVPGFPLGGHIHFSGLPLTSRLLRTLDTYLALPLVLLEDEQSRRRRPRYGSLGDFRRKRHGGFEYRALPSWLHHPERAAGVLALARLIALSSDSLMQEPLDHPDIRKLYYAGDSTRLLPVARKLWEELETMPAYGEYGTELNRLKREIMEETGRAVAEDFRPAWKIPPFGPAKTPLPEIMV